MTADELDGRLAALEDIVGRQAAAIARLEGRPPGRVADDYDPLAGLGPVTRWLVGRILDEVGNTFHVDRHGLVGPWRDAMTSQARFAAIWLVRRLTPLSLPRIGYCLGRRDHTTVMHALRRADGWRQADPDFAAATDCIADRLLAERAEWRP